MAIRDWVEALTGEIHRKKLTRAKFIEFFASLLPSIVAMEACGGSHHWARMLISMGHQVDLLPAGQVRPFVRGNKDDAADAKAIWTAATHGEIRRVPLKSCEQQAVLSLHRTRAHWVGIRTGTVNSMRGLLYEFGVWLPVGRHLALRAISDQRAEIDAKLPALMVRLLDEQLRTLREIDHTVEVLDAEILGVQKSMRTAKLLSKVPGIGPMGSTVLAAILGDGKAWRNGREFAASLGLCPGHTGTGGKVRVGSISKRGDPYARTLLVSGARSVACKKNAPEWVKQLLLRRPVNVVFVAFANKLARTAWAIVANGRVYEAQWKSTPPASASASAAPANAA